MIKKIMSAHGVALTLGSYHVFISVHGNAAHLFIH